MIHHTDISKTKHPEQLKIVDGNHKRRGYDLSKYGYHVAYHYFIGTTGRIVHTLANTDRTMHTLNDNINMHSVSIALAGRFNDEYPTKEQRRSLRILISSLQRRYGINNDHVIPHREASQTQCPGANLMRMLWPEMRI